MQFVRICGPCHACCGAQVAVGIYYTDDGLGVHTVSKSGGGFVPMCRNSLFSGYKVPDFHYPYCCLFQMAAQKPDHTHTHTTTHTLTFSPGIMAICLCNTPTWTLVAGRQVSDWLDIVYKIKADMPYTFPWVVGYFIVLVYVWPVNLYRHFLHWIQLSVIFATMWLYCITFVIISYHVYIVNLIIFYRSIFS